MSCKGVETDLGRIKSLGTEEYVLSFAENGRPSLRELITKVELWVVVGGFLKFAVNLQYHYFQPSDFCQEF